MVIDSKTRERFRREDLFDFARAYLSEAFPNPERAGCPQDHALRSFARNPCPWDPSIADHVTCCSPCFNAYTAHLADARAEANPSRETVRAPWIGRSLVSASLAGVGLLVVVLYAFVTKTRPPAPVSPPASSAKTSLMASRRLLLDLTTAVPERGHDGRSQTPVQSIPAEPRIDLTLRLPIGSEAGRYSVSLASKRGTQWSAAAAASIENGQPALNLRVDFSHIPDGSYELIVVSKEERLRVPVVIAPPPDTPR